MSMYSADQRCPRCQYPITPGAMTCGNCGLPLSGGLRGASPSDSLIPPPPPPLSPPANAFGPPPGAGSYNAGGYSGSSGYDFSGQPQPNYPGAPTYYGGQSQAPTYPGSQPQPGYPGNQPQPGYPGSQPQFAGGFAPPGLAQPPVQQRSRSGLKIGLIILAVLIVLGGGGGAAAYFLTRPKPTITVTSDYKVGATPAGSTTTVFQVTGLKFSASSTVSFLLDGKLAPDSQTVQSDASGSVTAKLTVSAAWAVGTHNLTASDANNYTTQTSQPIVIVNQGEAGTPGPNGAPTDSGSFIVTLTVSPKDAATGEAFKTFDVTLTVKTPPDTGNGQACNVRLDDGQKHSYTGTDNIGDYQDTFVWKCTGSYKSGKLSYTQTTMSETLAYTNGRTCTATTPYVYTHLDGTFTDKSTISGTYSQDTIHYTCDKGGNLHADAQTGTWTGTGA